MTVSHPSPMNYSRRTSQVELIQSVLNGRVKSGTRLDDLVKVSRCVKPGNPKEATSLVFQGTLMRHAVFGKIVWRNVDQQGGANTERKLMENQLFHAVKDGRTPCMPMRYTSLKLKFSNFLDTDVFRSVRDVMREGGDRRSSDQSLYVLLMEDCEGITLAKYMNSEGSCDDIHAIVFMLYHALSVLRGIGVSHNDLHGSNIILRSIDPTGVTFGDRSFQTATMPYIIDWDMGRSDHARNSNLVNYNHVGIWDTDNGLFDTIGLTKTLYWIKRHSRNPRCRAQSDEFTKIISVLETIMEPLRSHHSWLFKEALTITSMDGSVEHLDTVQQTPYAPDLQTGKAQRKWPSSVARDAPSLHSVTDALYMDMDADKKMCGSVETFKFPGTVREVDTPETPPNKRAKTSAQEQ